jgi:hypothetical protein
MDLGEMRFLKAVMAGLVALFALLALAAADGAAQDLSADLARAEQKVAEYEGELPAQQAQVSVAEARYRAAAKNVGPTLRTIRQDQAEAQRVRHDLAAQEQRAKTQISQASDSNRQKADDHDEEVRNGVGFGLAALVAGLIALGWGRFRSSAAVAALAELDLGRALGLCVGGGLLMLIVGAALGSSNGAVGALGSFIFCLGLILPTALLLARHSAEVQRGRSKPLLRREHLPSWVPMAVAGLMLVLFLASTGSAIFAGGASSQPISSRLQEEAEGASGGRGGEELATAEEEVAQAKQEAAVPLARRNGTRRKLASARRDLHHLKRTLASAKSSQDSFARRLVALEAEEQREVEREAARAQREEKERIEEEERTAEEEPVSECDYDPCLTPASDYDCEGGSGDGPAYTGTVEVIGTDIYGLDADGDGTGCEPY